MAAVLVEPGARGLCHCGVARGTRRLRTLVRTLLQLMCLAGRTLCGVAWRGLGGDTLSLLGLCAGVVAARARWAARLCIAACIGPGLWATEPCLHGRAAAVELWERTRAVVLAVCAPEVRAQEEPLA